MRVAPLLLADGPWLLYRSFFGLPASIRGAGGAPVNALLGMVNRLVATVDEHAPRAVVVCFGQEAAVYRVQRYPAYHAHRPPMPDELAAQFAAAPGLCEALGWYVADHAELEADDVMAGYAAAESAAGGRTLVLSGDRDMFQLADARVTILYPGDGTEAVTPDAVERRYGVPPAVVPDFIALRGDPSDGLPGARGIGEKTAADLLRRHGSLEAVIAAAAGERPRVATALREQAGELADFKEIATLRPAPVARPADRPTDRARGAAIARELGMRALAARLASG